MASRGESAASGASAASSDVSALESGSISAADSFASARRRRLPRGRQKPRDDPFPVGAVPSRQVDRDLQPFSEPPARFARAAERDRKAGGIESQQTHAAGSDGALGGVDPGDRGARRQRVEIVDRKNEPVRGRRRRVRVSDPGAKSGEKRPRRRRRRMTRIREIPGPGRGRTPCPPPAGSPLRRAWRPLPPRPSARRRVG